MLSHNYELSSFADMHRALLPAVVFLPLTPAFVIISCRCRQSTASPSSFPLRRVAKLLISHVTYSRRMCGVASRCLQFPKFFRHCGGNTYMASFFVFQSSAALEQDQPDIFVSWLPALAVIPSGASQRFSGWIVRATLPHIPWIQHRVAPSFVWMSDVLSLLSLPHLVCVGRCVRVALRPRFIISHSRTVSARHVIRKRCRLQGRRHQISDLCSAGLRLDALRCRFGISA